MAEGKQNSDWWHTANLLAMTANINRAKGKPAAKPADFHPFFRRQQKKAVLRGKDLELLKLIFCKPKQK